MYKKQSFELSHNEFLEISGIERVDFDHERNAPTPTGISATVRNYMKNGESLTETDVVKLLFNGMLERGFVEDVKVWTVDISPKHSWSSPDDEGSRYSVYTVEVSVYQRDLIFIENNDNKIVM